MRMLGRTLASVFAMLLGTAGGGSHAHTRPNSSVDMAWDETVAQDTLSAYVQFAIAFPDSKYTNEVYRRLSQPEDAVADAADATDVPAAATTPGPRDKPVERSEPYQYFAAS
jgi:hypothetical protein